MILVTGAAGFIGMSVARALLDRDEDVLGVDNLNDYYDVGLKQARLQQLAGERFTFRKLDISDREPMLALAKDFPRISGIVHLAAQAGVRYSLENPYAYVQANVMGQVVMMELARTLPALKHFVYASSSSVYGAGDTLPFSLDNNADRPSSLYAATKRMDELIGHAYAHLYGIAATGLRLFTVYGPWGRPDMAPTLFAKAICAGQPIRVFNHGQMWRDFTYIDDITGGIIRALDKVPNDAPPHRLYNLGNSKSEKLTDFISMLENALGKKAVMKMEPMQPGDVPATYADIETARRDLGFAPATTLAAGIPKFTSWFRGYYKV